ncbi:MAG: hypothetical protein NC489_40785 [Ruminococcus flavefaciens]|nr:hypothetical protein [Ruminococcus flavefaciens]
MIVTAWTNGSSGYGFKVRKEDLKNFDRNWGIVEIILPLDDGESIKAHANIDKDSFGKDCNELISEDIKLWFERKGLLNWRNGNPPKFELRHIKENVFKVERVITK